MRGRRSNGNVGLLTFEQPSEGSSDESEKEEIKKQRIEKQKQRKQVSTYKPKKKKIQEMMRKRVESESQKQEDKKEPIYKEKNGFDKRYEKKKVEEPSKVERQKQQPKVQRKPKIQRPRNPENGFMSQLMRRDKQRIHLSEKQKEEKLKSMSQRLDKIIKLKTKSSDNLNKASEPIKKADKSKKQDQQTQILVDEHYSRPKDVKVYSRGNLAYSVNFSLSDIKNNTNKFYIMQILESLRKKEECWFYTRYGRMGLVGQSAESGPMTPEKAIESYHAKSKEKHEKGYRKVEVNQNKSRNYYFKEKKNTAVQSKLEIRVKNLIKLIFDITMMNTQIRSTGYDSKKTPLGRLAKSNIIKGYEALKELLAQIKGRKTTDGINRWSSAFYSNIPHDFGMKNISNFLINTEEKVRNKLELLQSIEDIQIFTKIIDDLPDQVAPISQIDLNYQKLSYSITAIQKGNEVYNVILKYVKNTHAKTHNSFSLEVQQIFELQSKEEQKRYRKDLENKYLLWHGSRLTNYVGILSQGLRIAPPEAPSTGYMFGKGIYFADIVSKSAQYCHASKTSPVGLLLLCQVALGNSVQKYFAETNANLMTQQFSSVKGAGKSCPSDGQKLGEVWVPNGQIQTSGISNTSLLYNQYVVYDPNQVLCRYLVKFKFNFV